MNTYLTINKRKLPAGIQSFKTIREEGYVYVDKTDIVWYLANCGHMELRLKNFENCRILRNTLELSDVTGGGAELFLYQSGYLTIKASDEFGYTLGFPNKEVKQALYETFV